jgi:hypothetical protein
MTMKKYSNKSFLSFALVLLLCGSCTKLDEQVYGRLSPENFFKTEAEALSALAGVYNSMGFAVNGGNGWRLLHMGTDEFLIPARSDGRWFDGGVYIEFARHTWTPTNNRFPSGWNDVFRAIGTANAVIESLQNSPNKDNMKAQIAEARGVRAYAYFYAMDLWGNVPIVITARIEPSDLPTNTPRNQVFDFVIKELTEAAADLPSVRTVNRAAYYPRMTKEAAFAVMALAYLNAEVFTGTPKWAECIAMCNNVISSGGYRLTTNFSDNFRPANEGSQEFIYAISIDPTRQAGGNNFAQRVLHDSHRSRYGLPFTPQNGFTILEEAFNRYEDGDNRKAMILHGPQFDAAGNPLKTISGTANLVLIPHQNLTNAAENEGFRLLKWLPDTQWINGGAGNDVATIRYAEILLAKAEALLRSGGSASEALGLVNDVRRRSNASALTTLTLNDILDERGRELIYEGTRRRDMIRFGTWFTGTWKYKTTVTPEHRKLFPIPVTELNANPKLKQNPGYQ